MTPERQRLAGQILTLLVAAAFAVVGILMFANGQLGYILARPFRFPVLLGGIALLALVILRTIGVWRGDRPPHDHDDDLAWQSSRLIILAFPVGLFLIGLPNSGFSQDRIRLMLGGDDALTINEVSTYSREGWVSSFRELHAATSDPELRERVAGRTAVLEGRINQTDPRRLILFRLQMTCCAADVVPLKVRVVLKGCTLDGVRDFDWVRLKGQVQFVETPNSERMTPVIVVEHAEDIRKTASGNEYDD